MEIVKWLESVRDDSFGSAHFSRTQRILTADFSRTVKEDLHVRWIRNYENHKCIAHAKCGFLTSALLPSFLWHPSRSRSRGDYIPPSPDIAISMVLRTVLQIHAYAWKNGCSRASCALIRLEGSTCNSFRIKSHSSRCSQLCAAKLGDRGAHCR
jgi:hypothetical protein